MSIPIGLKCKKKVIKNRGALIIITLLTENRVMKKLSFLIIAIFLLTLPLFSYNPHIPASAIRFVPSDSGYELFIKKIEGVESILLTESQRDPQLKKTNYGLRTEQFYEANGNELRILEGKVLRTKYDVFFLVDSTTEKHPELGEAFRFFLPLKVLYGYQWSRRGELHIQPGMKINLRLFSRKYADYGGSFKDQWIRLRVSAVKENYRTNLLNDFSELAGGELKVKDGEESLKQLFKEFISRNIPETEFAEIVFIIDTTESMKEEIPVFKEVYPELLKILESKVGRMKVGFILYRDYGEHYLTKKIELTASQADSIEAVKRIAVRGGQDIPEAVNEAVYELKKFDFHSDNVIAFLFGDAPAHSSPRGVISRDDALKVVEEQNVKLNLICLPFR